MTTDFAELAELAEQRLVDERMLTAPMWAGNVSYTVLSCSDEELVEMLCDEQENARTDMLNRWSFERIV
jgi:hypothetical protein